MIDEQPMHGTSRMPWMPSTSWRESFETRIGTSVKSKVAWKESRTRNAKRVSCLQTTQTRLHLLIDQPLWGIEGITQSSSRIPLFMIPCLRQRLPPSITCIQLLCCLSHREGITYKFRFIRGLRRKNMNRVHPLNQSRRRSSRRRNRLTRSPRITQMVTSNFTRITIF